MNPTKEQLIAYFSGTLPHHQKREVENWLSDHPDNGLIEECIGIAMENMPDAEPDNAHMPERTLQAYARFRELAEDHRLATDGFRRLAKDHQPQTQSNTAPAPVLSMERPAARFSAQSGPLKGRSPSRWPRIFKYGMAAAAALIFFVIGAEWWRHTLPAQKRSISALPKQKVYYAARAAITRITLNDGSIVRLFPGSAITVSDSFNTRDRIIELKGRGFFEVAHNAARPFCVRSGQISTRVLGTVFDMNMDQKNCTRVVVKEGKVQVAGADSVLSDLNPGQGISVNKSSGRWSVRPVDADEYCSWTKGELGFRQMPLKEILPTLELWFNVSFHVQRPGILNKKLTFFVRRQNLKEAMEVLSATAGFRYQVQSNTIIIK